MPPFGCVFEIEGVNPRRGRGKTTEIKMVFNRQMIATLGVNGPDVLLYFLETAFDFPSRGIKLNHLFCAKSQVCGNQRGKKSPVIDEHNFDLASECFGHAEEFGKLHMARLDTRKDLANEKYSKISSKNKVKSKRRCGKEMGRANKGILL